VRRVAVVGGGITGLAAAHRLAGTGHEVVVLERDDRLGGKIRSSPFAGLPAVEEGPDAVLARVPWAVDLLREVGLGDDLVSPAVGKAYVWWGGRLHPIPDGLVLGVPAGLFGLARSPLLSWPGKLRAALEPALPRRDVGDSLGRLIRSRFGDEVAERLVDPLVGGINAGDADRLSLASVPQIAAVAARSRSVLVGLRAQPVAPRGPDHPVFVTPRAGLGALVDALSGRIVAAGGDVRTATGVTALEPAGSGAWRLTGVGPHGAAFASLFDAVLLGTPAHAAAPLLATVSPAAARLAGAIEHASVVMVTVAYPAAAVPRALDASGHLVPKPVQRHVTAASWASTKWAHWRAPGQVLFRVSVGRFGDEHAVDLPDAEVLAAVSGDLYEQLGIDAEPTAVRITRWPKSFPQYEPGHAGRVAAIEQALEHDAPGVTVAGAAYRGVGIPACINQGQQAAAAVLRRLDG
jgi:oxygen-dependent protoporphyrinogen oxidase